MTKIYVKDVVTDDATYSTINDMDIDMASYMAADMASDVAADMASEVADDMAADVASYKAADVGANMADDMAFLEKSGPLVIGFFLKLGQ